MTRQPHGAMRRWAPTFAEPDVISFFTRSRARCARRGDCGRRPAAGVLATAMPAAREPGYRSPLRSE